MRSGAPLSHTSPAFARLAIYAWGLVGIGIVAAAAFWLLGRIWVVVLPLVIAALLTRVLEPVAVPLRRRIGVSATAVVTLLGFLVVLGVAVGLLGMSVGSEVDELDAAVTTAVDDIEQWLVEDSPFDVARSDVERVRENAGDAAGRWIRRESDSVVAGVVLAGEILVSVLIGLVVTFFLLKDGRRFLRWSEQRLPSERRELARRLGARSWTTLGGYLRGAAILGLVEGVIAGVALTLVGGSLAVPIGVLTFLFAFIPFAGAIVASAVTVLVALATAGPGGAVIVAVVMLVVQQVDNDLLAPVVYGSQLSVHPVVILLSIIGGGALFGAAGTVLAVPVAAVTWNLIDEISAYREARAEPTDTEPSDEEEPWMPTP